MSDQPPDRNLPRVYYGEVDESEDDNDELPEYEGMQDDDDDDAPASPELIDWLGFDPDKLDEDEDDAAEDQTEEEDDQEQGLLPKAEVQYEHPASGAEHCAICVSFRSPDGCALVESPIQPEDWCNLFEGEDQAITVPANDAEWKEEQHKRGGNQENPGQFSAGSGGGGKTKTDTKTDTDKTETKTDTDKPSPTPSSKDKEFNDKLAKFGFRDPSGRDDIVGQAYYTNANGDMITVEKAAGGALEWYIISTDQDKAVNGVGIESLSAALRKQNYAELGNRVDSKIINGLEKKGYHQTHEDEYGTVYLYHKEDQTRISLKMDGNDLNWNTVTQDKDGAKIGIGKGLESLEKQIGNLDTKAKSAKIKALQDKALAVVVKSGYNPKMVSFSDEDKKFNLNGASYNYAGAAYIEGDRAGDIVFYNSQLTDNFVGRLAAHETMHQKFQMVLNEYRDEQSRMHDDKRGGDKWVMKPDGELREEYRADYPVYAALEPVFYRGGIWNKLQKEDGVTDYSRSWWEAHAKLTANFMQAAHETMAEMAANEWYNKNELIKTPGEKKPRAAHPNWQRVFKEVNQLYKTRADRAKNDPHQEAA